MQNLEKPKPSSLALRRSKAQLSCKKTQISKSSPERNETNREKLHTTKPSAPKTCQEKQGGF